MTPGRIVATGAAAALVAFGAAFGIGKLTGGEDEASASQAAERIQLDDAQPRAANLERAAAIPQLRSTPRRRASGGGGGGGGGSAPAPAPAPSPSPAPAPAPAPSPAPAPRPSPPPSGGGGGGGGGGGIIEG